MIYSSLLNRHWILRLDLIALFPGPPINSMVRATLKAGNGPGDKAKSLVIGEYVTLHMVFYAIPWHANQLIGFTSDMSKLLDCYIAGLWKTIIQCQAVKDYIYLEVLLYKVLLMLHTFSYQLPLITP